MSLLKLSLINQISINLSPTHLRLAVAELRHLPAVWVGGEPGARVTVQVAHQSRPNNDNNNNNNNNVGLLSQ